MSSTVRINLATEAEKLGTVIAAGSTAPGVSTTTAWLNSASTTQVRSKTVGGVSTFGGYLALEAEV